MLRTLRSKELLFLEVLDEALAQFLSMFRTAVSPTSAAGAPDTVLHLGSSIRDHDALVRLLLHGCVLGSEPAIGRAVRKGLLEIYRFLRDETGLSPEAAARLIGDMTVLAFSPRQPNKTIPR